MKYEYECERGTKTASAHESMSKDVAITVYTSDRSHKKASGAPG